MAPWQAPHIETMEQNDEIIHHKEDFDPYAEDYSKIINQLISITGEDDLFFVELRIKVMQDYFKYTTNSPFTILDFGCGTGRTAPFVQRYFPHSTYVGVDPSAKSIAVARKKYPSFQFKVLDSYNNLEENAFDIIFAAGAFHHISSENHLLTLTKIWHSLKSGGHFVLFEPNPYNPLMVNLVKKCLFDKGVTLLKPAYSKRILLQTNFTLNRLKYYIFFPKFFKFLRPIEQFLGFFPLGAQYMIVGKKE